MHYTAYHRAEFLASGPDLDEVLAFVAVAAATRRCPRTPSSITAAWSSPWPRRAATSSASRRCPRR